MTDLNTSTAFSKNLTLTAKDLSKAKPRNNGENGSRQQQWNLQTENHINMKQTQEKWVLADTGKVKKKTDLYGKISPT